MACETSDDNIITSFKIHVDNDVLQHRNNSIANQDDEIEEGEATGTDSEDEVEVNVIVDSQNYDSHKPKESLKDCGDKVKQIKKVSSRSDHEDFRNFKRKDSYYKPRKGSSTYAHSEIPSIEQDFGTDILSPVGVSEQKLEKRALRFGVTMSSNAVSKSEWRDLWDSLDLTQDDFHRGGFRAEAIHMRGIENLRSNEIFEYFKAHKPDNIEWLNNESCNIIFSEKENAAKALIGLSCPIIDKRKKPNNINKEIKSTVNTTKFQRSSVNVPPKVTKPAKKVKKKDVEIETIKDGSESESSSDDSSSSSDSEDEGSSSDSSSSSSSESTSSSSESSSSTSSSSDSEDEDSSLSKKKDKEETNNNMAATPMDVDCPEEQLGTVSADEVGVALPPGRWRLGVPCPNAKALLMRYAHCKDKKVPGIEKPVDFYEEYLKTKRSNKSLEQVRHRIQKELIDLDRRHRRKDYEEEKPRSRRTHHAKDRIEKPQQKEVGGKYVDLDDPYDDGKNPWGLLAQNWDRKETQDSLDYQALLHKHVTGQKRKRDSDSDSDNDDYRHPAHKIASRRSHRYKKSMSEDEFYSYSEEESDGRDDLDDGVDWRSKIRMPRMKMYADAEEKRKVKRNVEVKKRIHHKPISKGREIQSRVHFPMGLKQPGFDLRAMLQNKNLRRKEISFHPNSDGE